jgi:hypothetical protein
MASDLSFLIKKVVNGVAETAAVKASTLLSTTKPTVILVVRRPG